MFQMIADGFLWKGRLKVSKRRRCALPNDLARWTSKCQCQKSFLQMWRKMNFWCKNRRDWEQRWKMFMTVSHFDRFLKTKRVGLKLTLISWLPKWEIIQNHVVWAWTLSETNKVYSLLSTYLISVASISSGASVKKNYWEEFFRQLTRKELLKV